MDHEHTPIENHTQGVVLGYASAALLNPSQEDAHLPRLHRRSDGDRILECMDTEGQWLGATFNVRTPAGKSLGTLLEMGRDSDVERIRMRSRDAYQVFSGDQDAWIDGAVQ